MSPSSQPRRSPEMDVPPTPPFPGSASSSTFNINTPRSNLEVNSLSNVEDTEIPHEDSSGHPPMRGHRRRQQYDTQLRAAVAALRSIGACAGCGRRRVQCTHARATRWTLGSLNEGDQGSMASEVPSFGPSVTSGSDDSSWLRPSTPGVSVDMVLSLDRYAADLGRENSSAPWFSHPFPYDAIYGHTTLEEPIDGIDLGIPTKFSIQDIKESPRPALKDLDCYVPSTGESDFVVFYERNRVQWENPPYRVSTGKVHNMPGPVNDRHRMIPIQDNPPNMQQSHNLLSRRRPTQSLSEQAVQRPQIRRRPGQTPCSRSQSPSRAVSSSLIQTQSSPTTLSSPSIVSLSNPPQFAPPPPFEFAEAKFEIPRPPGQSLFPPAPTNDAYAPYDVTWPPRTEPVIAGSSSDPLLNVTIPTIGQQSWNGTPFPVLPSEQQYHNRQSFDNNWCFSEHDLAIDNPFIGSQGHFQGQMQSLGNPSAMAEFPALESGFGDSMYAFDTEIGIWDYPQVNYLPHAVLNSLSPLSPGTAPLPLRVATDAEQQQTLFMQGAMYAPSASTFNSGSMFGVPPFPHGTASNSERQQLMSMQRTMDTSSNSTSSPGSMLSVPPSGAEVASCPYGTASNADHQQAMFMQETMHTPSNSTFSSGSMLSAPPSLNPAGSWNTILGSLPLSRSSENTNVLRVDSPTPVD